MVTFMSQKIEKKDSLTSFKSAIQNFTIVDRRKGKDK